MANCKKTRPDSRPYEVWEAGGWTWKVVKKYQNDDDKPYARALCYVQSPGTFGGWDAGDVFIADYKRFATLVSSDYTE